MASDRQRRNRRADDRPTTGDVRPCPYCRAGSIVFNEQNRLDDRVSPAWVCENPACGYRVFARAVKSARKRTRLPTKAIGTSTQVHAKARPTVLKAKAPIVRSRQRIDRTEAGLEQRTRHKS